MTINYVDDIIAFAVPAVIIIPIDIKFADILCE